jgi:hypothetical protein
MQRAEEVAKQLRTRLSRAGLLPKGAASVPFDLPSFLRAVAAGLFFNAAQYERTEYDPRAPDDGGTHVYRLLRHTKQGGRPARRGKGKGPRGGRRRRRGRSCLCAGPGRAPPTTPTPRPPLAPPARAAPTPPPPPGAPLKLRIHPSSVLWRVRPELAVFHKCQQNDEGWYEMQGVTAVTQAALAEAAPHFYRLQR